eukprot:358817-Chlamydomonas_euryale.AAC.5
MMMRVDLMMVRVALMMVRGSGRVRWLGGPGAAHPQLAHWPSWCHVSLSRRDIAKQIGDEV